MNGFTLASTILAISIYYFLWKQIARGDAHQNIYTWILWAILDFVAAVSIFLQHGNFVLPAVYVGGTIITVVLIKRAGDHPEWTIHETIVIVLVATCMIVWKTSGNNAATVASTLAVIISGYSQMKDNWLEPKKAPFAVYAAYVVVNALATLGGKDWSIEERFYPAGVTVLCIIYTAIAARKFFVRRWYHTIPGETSS